MNRLLAKSTLFMVLLISLLHAQSFELDFSSMQGIGYQNEAGYFPGGFELAADYTVPFDYIDLSFGMNARTVQWGTQISMTSRVSKAFGKHVLLSAELQNGLALFKPNPLYVYSLGFNCRVPVIRRDKLTVGFILGIRYTQCPAYEEYGSIDHIVEIPLGIFFRF